MIIELTLEDDEETFAGDNVISFAAHAHRLAHKPATFGFEDANGLFHLAGCDVINLNDRRN